MLSYALAIAVGLSSLILFSTAFLMSDIHRQDDFFWSGVGLFYALVLWFCATRITGGLLLGQTAAVALLISYNWQTLKLRKAIANPEKAEELNNFSILAAINRLFTRGKSKPQPTITETSVTTEKITIPETPTTNVEPESTVTTEETPAATIKTPETKETVAETSTSQPVEIPAKPSEVSKKPGFFSKFFGGKKQKSPLDTSQPDTSSITNTKLDDILDDESTDTEVKQPKPSSATPATTDPVTETATEKDSITTSEDKSNQVEADKDTTSETITPVTETVTEEESITTSEDKSNQVETLQVNAESTVPTEAKAIASTAESTENSDNNEIKTTEASESKESETNFDEKPKN